MTSKFNKTMEDLFNVPPLVNEKETEFAYRQSELDATAKLQADKERLFEEREKEIKNE